MLVGTCSKQTNLFHTYTLFKQSFQKHFIILLRTEARVKSKLKQNLFQTHKHKENNFENDEQVPKSPWITTDRKGANTSPFYNLPPVLRNISKKVFYVLFHFPLLDEIKVGGDS